MGNETGGPAAQAGQAMAKTPEIVSIEVLVHKSAQELGQTLPAHLNPERMVRIALTAIRQNPELAKSTPESFLGALFVLAQVGLEPVGGRAYILPYKNRRKTQSGWITVVEAQAIIGYKGIVELFYRHESSLTIDAHEVCANDEFAYEYGTSPFLRHREAKGERGEVIAYYAVAQVKGGGSIFRVMSVQDAIAHGQRHSKTWVTEAFDEKVGHKVPLDHPHFLDSSPWAREPDAMCKKTAIIQLSKFLPLSVELQRAIEVDETSREYRQGIKEMVDLPVTTEWVDELVIQTGQPAIADHAAEKKTPAADAKPEVDLVLGNLERFGVDRDKVKSMAPAFDIIYKTLGKEKFTAIVGQQGFSNIVELTKLVELSLLFNALSAEIERIKKGDKA